MFANPILAILPELPKSVTFPGRNIFTVFMEEIFIMNSKGHNTKWDQ